MGAQKSKSKTQTDIVSTALSSTIISSSSTCTASSTSDQTLSFTDIKLGRGCKLNISNVTQSGTINQNLQCAQDSANSSTLQSNFETNLDQAVQAKLSGIGSVGLSESQADAITKLRTTIVNNISVSTVATCIANNLMTQKLQFGRIEIGDCDGEGGIDFSNISQVLISNQVATCLQSNKTVADASAELSNVIDQIASSENKGTDIAGVIGAFFTGLSTPFIAMAAVAGFVVLVIILSLFFLGKSGAGQHAIMKLSDAAADAASARAGGARMAGANAVLK
jgi:hypothetical protein